MFSLIFGGVGWVRLGWVGLGWVGLGWVGLALDCDFDGFILFFCYMPR